MPTETWNRFNPTQTEFDKNWNAEMARKEEERRARGTMPTTVVGPNGASPGKNIYGRTPEEEAAYRASLQPRPSAQPPLPVGYRGGPYDPEGRRRPDPAKAGASGTGDAFADFRARQQDENRARIADGYRQAAQESADGIRATAREQKAARDAMRMNQNKAAYALWSALDGTPEGDEILDGSVDSFMRLYNETMSDSGSSVTGYKKFMRRGADGKNEAYLRFTIKGADGTERTKDYGRTELMEGLMRHGVPKEAFAEKPAPTEEAPAAPSPFNKDFFGSLNPAAKAAYANGKRDGFTEADFIQPNAAAPEAPKAPEDPLFMKRADEYAAKYKELIASGTKEETAVALARSHAQKVFPMPGGASSAPAVSGAPAQRDSLSALETSPDAGESGAPTAGEPAPAAGGEKAAPTAFEDGKTYNPGDRVIYQGHTWEWGKSGWIRADEPANGGEQPKQEEAGEPPANRLPPRRQQDGDVSKRSEVLWQIKSLREQYPDDPRIAAIEAEFTSKMADSDKRAGVLRQSIDEANAKTEAANERAAASKEQRAKDEEFAKNYGRTPAELLNNIRGVLYRGQDMTAVQRQSFDPMRLLGDASGREAASASAARDAQRNDPVGEMLQGGKTLPPGVKMISLKKENVRTTVGKNGARDKHVTKNGEKERDRLMDLLGPALAPATMIGENMRETGDSYDFFVVEKNFRDLFNLQKKRHASA